MNYHLFTMMWGDHYLKLFERACFKSLNWPGNLSAIHGSTWNIFTRHEHIAQLEDLFKDRPFKLNIYPVPDQIAVSGLGLVSRDSCEMGVQLLHGLRDEVYRDICSNSKMIFAPPDTIWGEWSVSNLLKMGSQKGTCVAVCHPRVLPSILDEIDVLGATRGAISNASLVTLSFQHAHDSWKYAEIGHQKCNSYIGGIAWKKLSPGLFSVTHRLPTVYLADFQSSDFDFYWSQVSFGGWDHRWPAENLIRQERMRFVGSSDAVMVSEVTDWDKNVPPNPKMNAPKDDSYWNNHYHNSINRQFNVIMRGE